MTYQCVGVWGLTIGPVRKLDFTAQYGLVRCSVEREVAAFSTSVRSLLNFGIGKRKFGIVRKDSLNCLANIRCESPLVNFGHQSLKIA